MNEKSENQGLFAIPSERSKDQLLTLRSWRSSSHTAQVAGGWSLSADCVPQVVQMSFGIAAFRQESRCAISIEKAGRQTATYSAPSDSGVPYCTHSPG